MKITTKEKRDKSCRRGRATTIIVCVWAIVILKAERQEKGRERKKKTRNQPTFESRRYRLPANKTFSYLFQAFLCRLCLCSMARERLLLEGRAANSPAMAGKHTVWRLVKMLQILTCHVSSDSCLTFVR